MHGIRIAWLAFLVVSLGASLFGLGCGQSASSAGTTPATRSAEETAPRPSRPSASEVACHLHSCAPPRYCNQDKGVCELLPCTDSRDCPYGYKCDFSRSVCQ